MHNHHNRKSIRLKNYDYSQNGSYFITICTNRKEHLFGEIYSSKEHNLFEAGKIAEKYWLEIPKHYPNVILDMYVIIPNHVHGIIIIADAKPKDYQVNSF